MYLAFHRETQNGNENVLGLQGRVETFVKSIECFHQNVGQASAGTCSVHFLTDSDWVVAPF